MGEGVRDKERITVTWRARHLSVPSLVTLLLADKATVPQTFCSTSCSVGPRM